jgi:hypothetical protein
VDRLDQRMTLALILACAVGAVAALDVKADRLVGQLVVLVVITTAMAIRLARLKARRARRPKVLSEDVRAEALYLRQFDLDRGPNDVQFDRVWWSENEQPNLKSFKTFDDYVCDALHANGIQDIVAIVPDHEPDFTPSGPDRVFFVACEDEWQIRVRKLMTHARLVVIAIGSSEGVSWEMTTALAVVPRHRLLFLLPRGPDGDAWRSLAQCLIEEGSQMDVEARYSPAAVRFFRDRPVPEVSLAKACELAAQNSADAGPPNTPS